MFSVTQSAVAQSVRLNVVSKRSVKVRWVVVALFLFFSCFSCVSFSFKRARAVKEKSRWMMFSTLDDEDDEKCDWLSRARSLALSQKANERKNGRLNRTPFHSFVHSLIRFSRVHAFVQEEEHVLGRENSFCYPLRSCTRRVSCAWHVAKFGWFFDFFSLFSEENFWTHQTKHSPPLSLFFWEQLWRQLLRADERRFRNVQELLGWPIQLERLRRCRRERTHPGREEGQERQGRRGSRGETRRLRRQDGGWAQSRRRLISERFHFLLLKFFCFLTLLRVEQKKFTSRGIEKPDPKLNIFVISERAYPAHLHLLYTCSCICCFVISIDQRY